MDLKSGYPFWPLKDGILASYPPLQEDVSCDVVVVGGGVSGALAAYHLVDAGVEVVLVERRDVGWGSTSASTALLQYEIDVPLTELIALRGKAVAERAYCLCLQSIHTLDRIVKTLDDDCDFMLKKSLYLASTKKDVKDLEQEYAARQAAGIRLDFLTQTDIEAKFSFARPAALLSYDAAQVDAFKLTHRLIGYAQQKGMRAYDRTSIAAIKHKRKGVELVTDRGGTIRAQKIVMATGYESQQYLREKVTDLHSTFALASAPVADFTGWAEAQCLIWETADPYLYMRTTADRRIIMGGEDEEFQDAAKRDALIPAKTETIAGKFAKLFPDINLEVEYSWAGTFGSTQDGLAYIGETEEFPDTYFALGYGGNGITYSVVAAEIIRDLYLGKSNPDAEIFQFGR